MNTQSVPVVTNKKEASPVPPPARDLLELLQRIVAQWRTRAASSGLTDVRAVAAALFNHEGAMIAATSPLGLANLSSIAAAVRQDFPNLEPGHSVITNDPAAGGRSTQTFYMARRSGLEDFMLLLQFPTVDFGGETLGDFYPAAREIWAEGARVSPCLFADAASHDSPLLELLGLNSRMPLIFSSDVLTAVECLASADAELAAMARDGDVHRFAADALAAGSTLVRDLRMSIPADVAYRGSLEVEAGCESSATAMVALSLRSREDALVLDFTQSQRSPESFVNSYLATTRSAALLPLAVTLAAPLWNQSLLDAVEVLTAPGSVVDARLPSATGWAPYGVARAIAGQVSRACGQGAEAMAKWSPWVADPIFRFATPHCACERCGLPARRDPEDYAAMYVPSLIA